VSDRPRSRIVQPGGSLAFTGVERRRVGRDDAGRAVQADLKHLDHTHGREGTQLTKPAKPGEDQPVETGGGDQCKWLDPAASVVAGPQAGLAGASG
jgi:hypothetical protein